jgi:hypothetical protein
MSVFGAHRGCVQDGGGRGRQVSDGHLDGIVIRHSASAAHAAWSGNARHCPGRHACRHKGEECKGTVKGRHWGKA